MSIYESFGRLQERYDAECEVHRRTIGVLADLKAGRISLDQLEVDPVACNWKVTLDVVPEKEPCTPCLAVNGQDAE